MILDKCRSDRLAHATKLALDEIFLDAFAAHGALKFDLMLKVANTRISIQFCGVVGLPLNECPSSSEREWYDGCGHGTSPGAEAQCGISFGAVSLALKTEESNGSNFLNRGPLLVSSAIRYLAPTSTGQVMSG